jgi:hypothetical protein
MIKSLNSPSSRRSHGNYCHDMLQYRIRDEHGYTARVTLKEASLSGHDLTGDAKVKYDRGSPHHATYTCHFDGSGRLKDSSYDLY